MLKNYHSTVVEVLENGDAIIDIPTEMCEDLGWNVGDVLTYSVEGDTIILTKKEYNMQKDVKRFTDACDQNPSPENIELYKRLIEEEFDEFFQACRENDDVEQLDACMDMIWVILGYCHMKQFDIDGAWNEVTQSNLSKVDPVTGKVIRRADGKILKPSYWKDPDFTPYVKQ